MDIETLHRPFRALSSSLQTQGFGRFATFTLGSAAPSLRDFGHQEAEEHACYSGSPFGTSATRRPRSMPAIPAPPSGLQTAEKR